MANINADARIKLAIGSQFVEVEMLRDQVEERDNQIKDLCSQLAERDAKIAELTGETAANDAAKVEGK